MKFLLKIDPEFRSFIPPLSLEEREELQESLIKEGCLNPIVVWKGIILDGHYRYEICMANNIDFELRNLDLQSREEAIIWICRNQMDRRNLTEERRKYLIGKQYESEKLIGAMNKEGINQFSVVRPTLLGEPLVSRNKTAMRLAKRYHISHATVQKYETYSKAVDLIRRVDEGLVERMLSGEAKISHANLLMLSRMPDVEIRKVAESVRADKKRNVHIDLLAYEEDDGNMAVIDCDVYSDPSDTDRVRSVKDDPMPDPDSGILGISYTIPSWCYSIDRVRKAKGFPFSQSQEAKRKFRVELLRLRKTINKCLKDMRRGEML